jgi:hypothetical protein
MTDWFCQYTRDGILTLHIVFKAIDKDDAYYVLSETYQISDDQILDLHELAYEAVISLTIKE